MKYFPFVFILFVFEISGQPDVSAVHKSLKNNDMQSLCLDFDEFVDLDIPTAEGKLSKQEACNELSDFLSKNSVQQIQPLHTGTARNRGSFYSIGKINTNRSAYRLYIYYRKKKADYLIKEIRIEA